MLKDEHIQRGEKREAILEAALELIAEHGLQHTPMSLISRHARASAGVIYHHFESKEDLLQTLYWRIKGEIARTLVAADDPGQPLAKRFQTIWLSIVYYGLTHRREIVFLEQYESVPRAKPDDAHLLGEGTPLDALIERLCTCDDLPGAVQTLYQLIEECDDLSGGMRTLYRLMVDLRAQQLIKDLPLAIIGELTYGVALRLVKQFHAGQVRLDDAMLTEIARACWDAIAR